MQELKNQIHIEQMHHKIRTDCKETGETLLSLGHSDINQGGMLMSVDHRSFLLSRHSDIHEVDMFISAHTFSCNHMG